MTEPLLIHPQVEPFVVRCGDAARAQLWLRSQKPPSGVFLRLEPDNEERFLPMVRFPDSGRWRVYEAGLIPNPADPLTVYAFKVFWPGKQCWLDAAGQSP